MVHARTGSIQNGNERRLKKTRHYSFGPCCGLWYTQPCTMYVFGGSLRISLYMPLVPLVPPNSIVNVRCKDHRSCCINTVANICKCQEMKCQINQSKIDNLLASLSRNCMQTSLRLGRSDGFIMSARSSSASLIIYSSAYFVLHSIILVAQDKSAHMAHHNAPV